MNSISKNEPTIGQALLQTWKEQKMNDTNSSKIAPLQNYLEFNYQERYVKLCNRIKVKPVSLGAWLRKKVSTVI